MNWTTPIRENIHKKVLGFWSCSSQLNQKRFPSRATAIYASAIGDEERNPVRPLEFAGGSNSRSIQLHPRPERGYC
jgi:hypothetical protein